MGEYTLADEAIIEAVKKSNSYRQTLKNLGLSYRGSGNYKILRGRIEKLGLTTEHFIRYNRLKTIDKVNVVPTEKYLILNPKNKTTITTDTLKKRLIRDGFKSAVCEECGISTWQTEDAPLELHHINCQPNDNRIENLKILCSNCHTIEHRKINRLKKSLNKKPRKQRVKKDWFCMKCGKKVSKGHEYCLGCAQYKRRKIERPSKEIILDLVSKHGYSSVGRMYGVSDNAIRKWLKNEG